MHEQSKSLGLDDLLAETSSKLAAPEATEEVSKEEVV